MPVVESAGSVVEPVMPRSWRMQTKPHKFCPGCGHPLGLKALGEAIDELGLQDRAIFGCDIGCSLLAWDFFDLDTVQTHHGRTIPVLVGMKRARPELICVAYMGDGGGYAIGAQHLVNAALRNDPITVILANNTLYAMTGGQMAPTSLPGQKTETTPFGREVEITGTPALGPEMVQAVSRGRAYAARGSVANVRRLKVFIKKALQRQLNREGFSFVEALASCPTNWRTNAAETWDWVEKLMPKQFPVKEIKGSPDGQVTGSGAGRGGREEPGGGEPNAHETSTSR